MKHWVCIPCVTPHAGGDHFHDAVAIIEAETAEEAAEHAHETIYDEGGDIDPDYTGSMFVLEFKPEDFVALRRGVRFSRADDEWQCCAGPIQFTEDGHSGYCPNGKKTE